MAKQHHFYAVVLPGLEQIAAEELANLSAHDIEIEHGGIHFTGTMQLLYRVNLRARIITRVLLRLRTFRSMTLEGLKYDLQKIAWHLFLDESSDLKVEVHSKHSRLNHSDDIGAFAKDTIAKLIPKIATKNTDKHPQTLHIHLNNNRGILSLDTSGERLDRRGYRLASGKAPLRETLAAAMVQWSGWQPEQTMLVPMCGSGTLAIEAALIGTQTAANLQHDFAFLHYPSFKKKDYQKVKERCIAMQRDMELQIFASDNHESALGFCLSNAERAGVAQHIHLKQLDINQLEKPETQHGGVLLLNPPYGQRIGTKHNTLALWSDLGDIIHRQFAGDSLWQTIIICPDQAHEKALHTTVKQRLKVAHGGSTAMLLRL